MHSCISHEIAAVCLFAVVIYSVCHFAGLRQQHTAPGHPVSACSAAVLEPTRVFPFSR